MSTPAIESDKKGETYTTVRLLTADADDLSQLGDLKGLSFAKAYREFCSPGVRAALREALQKKLNDLDLGGEG